jgi:hypothetical protein
VAPGALHAIVVNETKFCLHVTSVPVGFGIKLNMDPVGVEESESSASQLPASYGCEDTP